MVKTANRKNNPAKLPNAPLTEVVFEFRWALGKQSDVGAMLLHSDPGFVPALESFARKITQSGFPIIKDMASEPNSFVAPYSVARRFYSKPDFGFPLMQFGPGIFASNQSTEYVWASFRKQARDGLRQVLASYPKLPDFPLRPIHLELRYVDAFDDSTSDTKDYVLFVNEATNLKIEAPAFLTNKKLFSSPFDGRTILARQLTGQKETTLTVDIASANTAEGKKVVRMETKIITQNVGVPKLREPKVFIDAVDDWLVFAHDRISPLFKDFVKPAIMAKFEQAND
jgi:uncharacterized protein (TIGR04255 family)